MSREEYTFIGGMIAGQHCMVLNPRHPSWTKEEDDRYRRDFLSEIYMDTSISEFRHGCRTNLGRYNGRDIERLSLPDVLQLCFPETPEEAMLAFSISNFWVGRVL